MSPKGSPHGEEERLVLEEVEMQKRSSVPRSTSTQQVGR